MSKPKHRRCGVCDCVTARYIGSQDAGAFVVKKWARDQRNGEHLAENGAIIRCEKHADQIPDLPWWAQP